MHYVYKITNLISGKVYIGKRKHPNPYKDSYMGSGKLIKAAIKKYGAQNFKKEILKEFESNEEAAAYERSLVTKEFIACKLTYNMHEGGHGGFAHWNNGSALHKETCRKGSAKAKEIFNPFNEKTKTNFALNESQRNAALEKALLPEAQEKKKNTYREINHQKGSANSNFGKCWVYNQYENKSILKEDLQKYLSLGYTKGRKMAVSKHVSKGIQDGGAVPPSSTTTTGLK